MIDRQTVRQMIIELEAFRGHEPEEYYPLVEPLSEFVFNNRFRNLFEVNKLVKAILIARPETTTREIEPSVTAQLLADQIKPWIEDIRQTLFHSKSAPFSRIEDVEIWWDEAEKKVGEWHKRVDEWHKRVDERLSRMKEWGALWQAMEERYPLIKDGIKTWAELKRQGISVDLPKHEEIHQLIEQAHAFDHTLEVGEPPEQDEQVKLYGALLDDILEIVKVTGFTAKSVKMYILVDASPVLPPFTFGILRETHLLPSGISLLNRFARVTIRGDLTFENLRSLYRSIRRELGIKRSKRPTTKHLQLYEMVRRRGGIPSQRGTVAFWESVMKEWNDLHRQDKYKTWKGVKLAYERIIAQLERRITTKEANHERTHSQEV
jgi:hypothetical protein